MKKTVNALEYANLFTKSLHPGFLLNTQAEKFNSMVIGWGHIGIVWGLPTVTVYVRQSRYTKHQVDEAGEFTLSLPLEGTLSPEVMKVCGSQSGRDVEKAELFTLAEPRTLHTPGVMEYPLTLECKVLYAQDQDLDRIPEDIREKMYGRGPDLGDFHTAYIAQIADAYILEADD